MKYGSFPVFGYTGCLKSLNGFSIFHMCSICILYEGKISMKTGFLCSTYLVVSANLSDFQLYCLGCPSTWLLSGSTPVTGSEATIGLGLPFWPVGLCLASHPHGSCEVGQELCPNFVGPHLALLCSSGLSPRICSFQKSLWLIYKWTPEWKVGRHCPMVYSAHSVFVSKCVTHLLIVWRSYHVLVYRLC